MATVYIIYSNSIDTFYIGSCLNLKQRLEQHRDKTFNDSFTRRASDWKLFLKIDNLDYRQARKIENHIKKMKSRKYINNLKKYPEIIYKLIQKYQ